MVYQVTTLSRALEFLHFGLTAKYQLTTALARLRERGDRAAVGERFADLHEESNPSPQLHRTLSLGEGRYQLGALL
jgi:hypothetical protein